MDLLWQLALIIATSKLAGDLAIRLGQPSVLGKLLVGVILGPAVLGWIHNSDIIDVFSQIGVIVLMFFAGIETDMKALNENRNSSLAVAVGGIIFPLAGGWLFGAALGMEFGHALFLGLLLSATSVSITVQTFKELGQLKSKESATVLGAAILDDILVVLALAFAMSFLTSSDASLGLIVGKKLAFFAIIAVLIWKGIPLVMRALSKLKTSEPIISAAIVICLATAYVGEYLGVSGIIGAFAAGLAISRTAFKHEVEKKLEPIAYTFFVPVFFASIGLSVSFEGLADQIWIIIALSVLAVLTKLLGAGLGAQLTGHSLHSSLIVGAGMISRGEVALIIAAIGLNAGLLLPKYYTMVIVVVLVSTLVTPPLLKLLVRPPAPSQSRGISQ